MAKRISPFHHLPAGRQVSLFDFVAGSIQLSNFELIRDIAKVVDFIESPIV